MKTLALLLASLLFVAGCADRPNEETGPQTSPPAAIELQSRDHLLWTGTGCAELGLAIPTEVANVRPFVPSQYSLLEVAGRAVLMVGTARCDTATVDGHTTNNLVMSDVGVFIESPTGEAGSTFYYLWHASNRDTVSVNMSRVGTKTHGAPNSNFLTFGLVQTTIITSRIGADEPYQAQGTALPVPVPASLEAAWYHSDENATVRTDFRLALRTEGPATGNVTATPGSDLAKLLGSTQARGDGVYWTFDLEVESRRT